METMRRSHKFFASPKGHALILTGTVHLGMAGAVFAAHWMDTRRGQIRATPLTTTIEAGLAIRRRAPVDSPSQLPQKETPPTRMPSPAPRRVVAVDELRLKPVEDAVVAQRTQSVFAKYRHFYHQDEEPGVEPLKQKGTSRGSDWGTLADVRGDPYVGKLLGLMTRQPEFLVPSVVTGGDLMTWGCIRLDAEGRIVGRWIHDEVKSNNRIFNRAVEERLKLTSDMVTPVPPHLVKRLVGVEICVPYRY